MKIHKSDDLNLLFRTFVKDNRCWLSASVLGFFSLNGESGPPLLPGVRMWPAVAEVMGEEALDLGLPKKRGEFLVYGSAYSPKPVKSVTVRIRVGAKTKELAVLGDRSSTSGGWTSSDPSPFTQMEIRFTKAYGGPDYPPNPIGKGHSKDGDRPLPNVQDPRNLIASPDDKPVPVGLTSLGPTWPQRTKFIPKIDSNYLARDWPYFPQGTDGEYFNTAPEDQRLTGFFQGEEKIEIHNMHSEKPVIKAAFPPVRPRLFINQTVNHNEVIKEIGLQPETLWLFPDREQGIVLYRGLTAVADEEHEDVRHCLAEVEPAAKPPLPEDHYKERFRIWVATGEFPSDDEDAPPPELNRPPSPMSTAEKELPKPPPAENKTPEKSPEELEQEARLAQLEEYKAQAFEKMRQLGVDPEEFMKKLAEKEKAAEVAAAAVPMEVMLADLEKQTDAFLKKMGYTKKEILQKVADMEKNKKPLPTAKDALEMFRAAGLLNPELEKALVDLDKVQQEQKAREEQEEPPKKKPREKTVEKPIGPEKPKDAAEALAWIERGKSLAGLDLSGFDFSGQNLSGVDFQKAVLEKTIFSEADLSGALFSKAVMIQADFSGADLTEAILNGVTAEGAVFSQAKMNRADLTAGDFTKAMFSAADMTSARVTRTSFEKADMKEIKAQNLQGDRAMFESADLTGADFTGADLAEAYLSGSNITGAVFREIKASTLRVDGVHGENADFRSAVLTGSRADKATNLPGAVFIEAELSAARWAGAALPGADLTGAKMDGADFSRTDLSSARLQRVRARRTEFMKADLTGANLSLANLFKGSLRKAALVRANLASSNLYGVDFYKAKIGDTNMSGANLKNTLLTLRP